MLGRRSLIYLVKIPEKAGRVWGGGEKQAGLTSLQGPFGDLVAVGAPACAVVGGDLDLVIGPDDEVLQ